MDCDEKTIMEVETWTEEAGEIDGGGVMVFQ